MSQLNFFFTLDEVQSILNHLLETDEIDIFNGGFFESEFPKPIKNINEISKVENLTFWLKNDIMRPKCYSAVIGAYKDKWLFDYYKDPVILFHDCKRTKTLISPGRIFYKAGWVENVELRKKHKNWTAKVSKVFDRNLKKINNFWRISQTVENWVLNGGLELGQNGKRIEKKDLYVE